MSDEFKRKAIERRLNKQKRGEAAAARIKSANPNDWRAVCRICGQSLEGTLAQIKEHTHGTDRT